MAAIDDRAGAVHRAAGGAGGEFVRGFVKSGSAAAAAEARRAVVAAGGFDGVAGIAAVEAIGREQQRRAVAYSRSRGQL